LPLVLDLTFPHDWKAEVLTARPLILPARQFVYPALVEEVERGALEIMIRPAGAAGPFLATCALGFVGDIVPSGLWACPDPAWICAVAGGYAYLIDTRDPARWEQLAYRPVTNVTVVREPALLVFAGFHSLLAWGSSGKVWETGRLSWDGLRITAVRGETLQGMGWDMTSDRELEFHVNLKTGEHQGGGYLA
jgi:hypothetical protein